MESTLCEKDETNKEIIMEVFKHDEVGVVRDCRLALDNSVDENGSPQQHSVRIWIDDDSSMAVRTI